MAVDELADGITEALVEPGELLDEGSVGALDQHVDLVLDLAGELLDLVLRGPFVHDPPVPFLRVRRVLDLAQRVADVAVQVLHQQLLEQGAPAGHRAFRLGGRKRGQVVPRHARGLLELFQRRGVERIEAVDQPGKLAVFMHPSQ